MLGHHSTDSIIYLKILTTKGLLIFLRESNMALIHLQTQFFKGKGKDIYKS